VDGSIVRNLLVKLVTPSLYMVPVKIVRKRLAVNALCPMVSHDLQQPLVSVVDTYIPPSRKTPAIPHFLLFDVCNLRIS
jgi:hypothetical protein